ncbi:MAG: TIGR00282 family metallophosphoesterase [Candidatus Cloacimonetes bacterium]|nr:TIGR00282 family metallophosphoesterase [Candidatus Cloacimonadota bacterium]MCF7814599.1 TIGR00282 family metallophosphoesterase [Candidatus Cloacimonadota bacterium]MCF7869079.1 TIGR00282 family metallophosphoesterase [Candidatus Cloacimonadota bacterium]MCF7884496.1 TIGR00282 family metallophosphoesterase [Candidatus Cloacimonadota bacterium]
MRILFFGDVFGKPGRKIVKQYLPGMIEEFDADVVIANGENLAQGRGVTEKTCAEVFEAGVAALTSGNHLWDQKTSLEYIKNETRIIKPLNFPHCSPGFDHAILDVGKSKLAIITLVGQAFMGAAGFPFEKICEIMPRIREKTPNILVDYHAEATAEKRALGFYLDGKISALVGTHTHIQTADEEILPHGTAYITDVGMTGPHDSIIGTDKDIILQKILTGVPRRFDVAKSGLQINAVIIEISDVNGKALLIQRIRRKLND